MAQSHGRAGLAQAPCPAGALGRHQQGARHRVSADDVAWADVILVMEERHQSRLKADFGRLLAQKRLHVLDIPDEYRYMDPELVDTLQTAVSALLQLD